LKLFQEWGKVIKENDGGGESKTYCKNFCKCTMYPKYNNNIILKIKKNLKREKVFS
jgi:hypothetical protein